MTRDAARLLVPLVAALLLGCSGSESAESDGTTEPAQTDTEAVTAVTTTNAKLVSLEVTADPAG